MGYHNDNYRMLHIPLYDPRAQPLPAETIGVFDAPRITLCVNRDWARKHIANVVHRLSWEDAWDGTENDVKFSVSESNRLLQALSSGLIPDGACVSIGETLLRQNPENPCHLEQSTDDGATWTLAFDYSLCLSPSDRQDALQESIDLLNNLLASWTGNVGDVAPNMVYDMTPEDTVRDIALCHATYELVVLMCEMELQRRREIALASTITGVILGLVGLAVTVVSAGSATPFYLAVAGALAGGFGSVFGGLSEAILNDRDARQDVACCMFNALMGNTITQLSFEQSLDNCNFTALSNEAQLAGAVAEMLTQDNMYRSFVDYLERSYKLAELGIATCLCDVPWEHTFDFVGDNTPQGWSATPQRGTSLTPAGWLGNGLWTVPSTSCENRPTWHTEIETTFVDSVVTEIEVHFTSVVPAQRDQLNIVSNNGSIFASGQNGNALPVTVQPVNDTINYLKVTYLEEFDCGSVEAGNSVDAEIIKVVLRGVGTNPFI